MQMFEKIKHIHFVGIGGVGMAGIAQVLHTLGYIVSGSDLRFSETTRQLSQLGVKVFFGHHPAQVKKADVIVVSTAIPSSNPELTQAKTDHIPIIPRAEMLAELMRLKYGIAIAGTHGKTTTTSLISLILTKGSIDPTVIVGGKVNHLNSNAKLGEGKYLVAEADESDGSFLTLNPSIVVVTNIDNDHLDYYGHIDGIKRDFLKFINKIPFYGIALLCSDDENITSLLSRVKRRYITYGLKPRAEISAKAISFSFKGTTFELLYQGRNMGKFKINLLGRHNLTNALAAIALGIVMDIDLEKIKDALIEFKGVERRFQILGETGGTVIIDDYGHHPTEITAALAAVKACWPKKKLKVIFQPHRYSRTRLLHKEFGEAFKLADSIVITDIYPAGESVIPGVNSELIINALEKNGKSAAYHPDLDEDLKKIIIDGLSDNEVLLTLGAGDIGKLGRAILGETKLNPRGKINWKDELNWLIRGGLKFEEPMSYHTTIGVGGPAECWVEPKDTADLKNLMVFIKKHNLPYFAIGKGSNIIVKDRGIRGLVINLSKDFQKLHFNKSTVEVQAGLNLSDLVLQLEKNGLSGLEFLKGVPGTVGGSLWMNAGLPRQSIADFVTRIKIINEDGEEKEFNKDELKFFYRKSILPEPGIIYSADLELTPLPKEKVKEAGETYFQRKVKTQPLSFASAGCIFKNPEGKCASRLIDNLKLKGSSMGGAEISRQHANFIIKKGKTNAADILSLIKRIEKEVKEKQGINLEKEIIIVGED